ncbi:hypothetical protein AVEN_38769-1 [Araneus ventricosus]|uniref:Uncharacterized protein n=1 Tax=Araneus ventricosus TaxID=182803 RepID=A0A4Y2CR99_ARAVE|nr:hypothetical protein AVEN_38769-1 [Araneus ventricosus]
MGLNSRFSGDFDLLASSSNQGRKENHSSLSRVIRNVPFKLRQKLLDYNRTVRADIVMNEDNSRSLPQQQEEEGSSHSP